MSKMVKIIGILLFVALLPVCSFGAWQVYQVGNVVNVIPDGIVNSWDCTKPAPPYNISFPQGMNIQSINFNSSAANDKLYMTNQNGGTVMFPCTADTMGAGLLKYENPNAVSFPYCVGPKCVFGTAANVVIEIDLR